MPLSSAPSGDSAASERPFFALRAATSSSARRVGLLSTRHGSLPTPALVPVGPLASAGSLTAEDLGECGTRALGVDWLRVCMRPGVGFFRDNGGLGSVVGWSGPLIAGSSAWAFDPASRGGRVGVDTASVISPFDGATLRLAPEGVVEAQVALGFDIAATLDWPDSSARLGRGEAVSRRRLAWAERSLAARPMGVALLAGVAAAAPVEEIRELGRLPFDGFVLNGIVHAEIELTETQVAVTERARLLGRALGELPVGVLRVVDWRGDLPGLSDLIEIGIDLVRLPGEADRASARLVLTAEGQVDATTEAWRDDPSPLDPDCRCPTCSQHSRAYVRHLAIANELLAFRLIERHNLAWLMRAVSGDLPGPSVQ